MFTDQEKRPWSRNYLFQRGFSPWMGFSSAPPPSGDGVGGRAHGAGRIFEQAQLVVIRMEANGRDD